MMFFAAKQRPKTSSKNAFVPSRSFSEAKATTLNNGIRVVSLPTANSGLTSLGLFVGQAGSRGETATTAGSSHYLRRLAFKGTAKFDKDSRTLLFANAGGEFGASTAKEYLLYSLNVPQSNASQAIAPFGQSLQPRIEEYLVSDEHHSVELESSEQQNDLSEKVHQIAYRHQGLGNPINCPPFQFHHMDADLVKYHWARYFRQKNVAVVGVGIDHGTLEGWTSTNFGALDWEPEHTNKSKYTGGEGLFVSSDSPRLALGFEAVNLHHKDRVATLVLQSLVGGSRPSAKSQFSETSISLSISNGARLGQSLSSEFDGAQLSAHYDAYSDSGLFWFEAEYSCSTQGTGVINAITSEVKSIADGKVSAEELRRAKTTAKIHFAKSLQCRSNLVKFLGEQALASSGASSPEQFIKKMDEVTVADLQRVAKTFAQSNPTLVGLGDVAEGLPTIDHVKKQLSK